MGFDIRQFTDQGITKYEPTWYEFTGNTRNTNQYRVLFRYFVFNPEIKLMTAFFKVERYELQNDEYQLGLSYTFEALAGGATVDYEGNLVDPSDPSAVMTEFERMSIFFNAPLPDSVLVDTYVNDLFGRGFFDYPKNRNIS